MRIAVLTRYGRKGASSRLRFLQYFPDLSQHAFVVQYAPLFSDAYVDSLQSGRVKRLSGMLSIIRRIAYLRNLKNFDLLWVEKDALPWVPLLFEIKILPKGTPLVLDYDDAVFHYYDNHPNPFVRLVFGNKHRALMQKAALVVAGNEYLADYARSAGANQVKVLPTVIDLSRYESSFIKKKEGESDEPVVGWIGQRSTAGFLHPLLPLLVRLRDEGLIRFRVIGIDSSHLRIPVDYEAWSEQTEVGSIQKLDIGLMPLSDNFFTRGKCGYKLIQYMACGIPVIASPVGVNSALVQHGVNGFLVNSIEEWESALRVLAKNHVLRDRMGRAGRAKVEREYSLQVTAPLLIEWLTQVANTKRL